MPFFRIATFDFGSNSLKLTIFRIANHQLVIDYQTREFTVMGDDVFSSGTISEAKAREVEEAIARLKSNLQPSDAIAAAATSAFREARNGAEMAARFAKTLGALVPVLSGEDEAALLAEGVLGELDPTTADAAVLDIGGGSMEIITVHKKKITHVTSLDLGASRLRERFAPAPDDQPPSPEAMQQIDAHVQGKLQEIPRLPAQVCLLGSGGGFTTLCDVIYGKENHSGVEVTIEQIQQVGELLRTISAGEIAQRYNLPIRRARIMAAGSIIAERMLQQLGVDIVTISWAGLREGLARRILRLSPQSRQS